MVQKAKEKRKKQNTKDEEHLNLDNEIVIGIKTLPKPKVSKKKQIQNKKQKNKKNTNLKTKNKKEKKNLNQETLQDLNDFNINSNKKKNTKKKVKKKKDIKKARKYENEFELKLGIEDKEIKNKNQKKNEKTLKKQEVTRKKRKIIFRVVKIAILLLIVVGGGACFMLSPFFNIKEIITIGNEKITSEELISLSGIILEENTFKIQTHQAEQAIKENTYIDQVSIKRKLPDKIEIQVVERKPSFMITFANAYVYISNQGYMLEVSPNALNLPIITGYLTEEDEIREGGRLCSEDLQRLEHVLQIMKSAESNGIKEKITKINIADKQEYVLELTSEKKKVYIGDNSNLSTKMLYILSILEENKDVEGEIFVNTDLNNKGAIFRKKI